MMAMDRIYFYYVLLFFIFVDKRINCVDTRDELNYGKQVITDFYERYNTTEIDLVFVMDRSASVDRIGWLSMVNFARSLLEHFTVDSENTRVAFITYSTSATIVINDLENPTENKCSLMLKIRNVLYNQKLSGYTATHDALQVAVSLFINCRPNAKKAVFVLTDGRSNIGPPPVRASVDLRSIQWNSDWNTTEYGPQLEIYGLGIQNADLDELRSIASPMPNHTLYIPNFKTFKNLARYLHRDKQDERWSASDRSFCGGHCSDNATCTCGTKSGDYQCVCKEGYQGNGIICEECPIGYFKSQPLPLQCQKCPLNMTTSTRGTTHEKDCILNQCPALPDISNGRKFHVQGEITGEVPDLGLPCDYTLLNSCHYKCHTGYRLNGHPGLTCTSNGTWMGDVPSCKVIDCKSLAYHGQEVEHGNVTYVNGTTTYGSLVQVTCDTGWQLYGNATRTCNEHGVWGGTRTWCIEAKCHPLPSILGGQILPRSCSGRVQSINTTCRYECQAGYTLSGADSKTCKETGQWSPNEPAVCKDTIPPSITCPDDVTAFVYEGNYTILSWDEERPKVNDSAGNVKVKVDRPQQNPAIFSIGHHQMLYTAEDEAGNRASCNRSISVIDKNVYLSSCPGDILLSDVTENEAQVSWPNTMFVDGSKQTVPPRCTRQSGSIFSIGTHNVVCQPQEHRTSIYCAFNITLKRKKCAVPPAPLHGSLSCFNSSSFLQQCSVMCNDGFDFYNLPQTFYKCDLDGNWMLRDNRFWPDCSLEHYPGMALMEGAEFDYYYYGGNCETIKSVIAEKFRAKVQWYAWDICGDQTCQVTGVKVTCGERSRRSIRETEVEIDAPKFRYKRESKEEERSNAASESINSLSEKDNTTSDENIGIAMGNSSAPHGKRGAIKFLFDIKVFNTSDTTMTFLKYRRMKLLLGDAMNTDNITLETEDGEIVEMIQNEFYANKLRLEYEECTVGYVRKIEQFSVSCVGCPPGTYFVNSSCEECHLGFYQSKEGHTSCASCPTGTTTSEPGAKDKAKCRKPCLAGHYSATTLEPCTPCDMNYYQDHPGQTSCLRCPRYTGTLSYGTTSVMNCKKKCAPGTYSFYNGLEPCTACPLGTYQPLEGAVTCMPCLNGSLTLAEGATSSNQCTVIDRCHRGNYYPCLNNGVCRLLNKSYVCNCPPDVTGSHCETPIDPCMSSPCNNNGTCATTITGYRCKCESGFTGKNCDVLITACERGPCLNGGSCVEVEDGYQCYCIDGYSGQNCDRYNICASYPCRHGNCENHGLGYVCKCHKGYTGLNCDTPDLCMFKPCKNNGTCEMIQGEVQCTCNEIFKGELCEAIDSEICSDRMCNNHGTCIEVTKGIICRCNLGYGGKSCDIEISPDYDLIFQSPSVTDYATIPLVTSTLKAFTACMWLRTADTANFGTPFSYSASSADSVHKNRIYKLSLSDYGQFQLFLNDEVVTTDISVNDGNWQHICLAWENDEGVWEIYLNGTLKEKGDNLGRNLVMADHGTLVIGQEQHDGQPFSSRDSFVGEITQFNVFDKFLKPEEIRLLAKQDTCNMTSGTVVAWVDVIGGISGDVIIRNTSHCLDFNECAHAHTHSCPVNQKCTDKIGGYKCDDGIDNSPNPCASNPCMRNMTCERTSEGYKCICIKDSKDSGCITKSPACSPNPCKNLGICNVINNSQVCDCRTGFIGKFCDDRVNLCQINPCRNGGECLVDETKEGLKYSCKCQSSWKGRNCTLAYRPTCKANPCLNNGTCMESSNSILQYKCNCQIKDSVTGPNCELDPCLGKPCKNSGICVRGVDGSYKCLCEDPFTGLNCEVNPMKKPNNDSVSESRPNIRKNRLEGTSTTTQREMATVTTEILGQESCDSLPCQNGGVCRLNEVEIPSCICPNKFKGDKCEFERKRGVALYNASLVLRLQYISLYNNMRSFRRKFIRQIRKLYREVTTEDAMTVQNILISSIYNGETSVTFQLKYSYYVGSPSTLSASAVEMVLKDQMSTGFLGIFPVEGDLTFQAYRISTSDDSDSDEDAEESEKNDNSYLVKTYFAVALVVLLIILLLFVVFIVVKIRKAIYRRRHGLLRGLNNAIDLSLNNNPVFEHSCTLDRISERHPSGEENIYAELSEYADPEGKDGFSGRRRSPRHSSSRSNKDCNVDTAATRKTSDIPMTYSPKLQTSKTKLNSTSDSDSEHHYFSPVFSKNEFSYSVPVKDSKGLLPSSGKTGKHSNLEREVYLNSTSSDGSTPLKTPTYTEPFTQREVKLCRKGNDSTETLPFSTYVNTQFENQSIFDDQDFAKEPSWYEKLQADLFPKSVPFPFDEEDVGITLDFKEKSVPKEAKTIKMNSTAQTQEMSVSRQEMSVKYKSEVKEVNGVNQNEAQLRQVTENFAFAHCKLEEAESLNNPYIMKSTAVESSMMVNCTLAKAIKRDGDLIFENDASDHQAFDISKSENAVCLDSAYVQPDLKFLGKGSFGTDNIDFCYTVPMYIVDDDKKDAVTNIGSTKGVCKNGEGQKGSREDLPICTEKKPDDCIYITPDNHFDKNNTVCWKSTPDMTSTHDDYEIPNIKSEIGSTDSFLKLLQRTQKCDQNYMDMSGVKNAKTDNSTDPKYDSDSQILSSSRRQSVKLKKKRSKSMHDYLEILPSRDSPPFCTLPRGRKRKDIANRKLPPVPRNT